MTATRNVADAAPHTVEKRLLARFMTRDTYQMFKEKMPQHVLMWQVALETLFKDEDELRETLLNLGGDGLQAANLCRDLMLCRDQLDDVKLMLQQAAGRTFLMLEDMEGRGQIETTDEIFEPLREAMDKMVPVEPEAMDGTEGAA